MSHSHYLVLVKQVTIVLLLALLIACGGGGLHPSEASPTILSKTPENQTTDVDETKPIVIKFSETVTISASNISLRKYQTNQPNNFNDPTAILLNPPIPLLASGGVSFDSTTKTLTIQPILGATNYVAETRYQIELSG